MAVYTVTNENIAVVWARSGHLVPPLVRLAGSSKALMHRKKKTMTIPRMINPTDGVSVDNRVHKSPYRRISRRGKIRREMTSLRST